MFICCVSIGIKYTQYQESFSTFTHDLYKADSIPATQADLTNFISQDSTVDTKFDPKSGFHLFTIYLVKIKYPRQIMILPYPSC